MSGNPWADPMFFWFAIFTTLLSAFAFLLFAVPLSLLAWRDPESLRKYRIQLRKPRAQELVVPSLGRWFVNNALMLAVVTVAWPLLRHSGIHGGPMPSVWTLVWQVLLFIYLDDFCFYWMHRTLHQGWLYKKIHSVHHRILTPWAITGHYMHPVEYVLTGSLVLLGPTLLQSHLVTVWIWVVFRQWEAAEGHCGYDFPWTPTHHLPGGDGAVHHDFHHAKVKGNYAGFFKHCDWIFGTYARGYEDDLKRRNGG